MAKCSILHTADLHLGSPFSTISHLTQETQALLVNSSFESLVNLTEYAIGLKVDFVLISGDIFDSCKPSLKLQNHFISQMEKLSRSGVTTYIICGNHDQEVLERQIEALAAIENLHIFGKDLGSHTFQKDQNKFMIHGISFDKDLNLREVSSNIVFDKDYFHIFLLHADVAKSRRNIQQKKYSEFDIQDLTEVPVDYWALGHLHNFEVLHKYPHVVYPGTIQGRSFKPSEQGDKGFCLFEVDNNKITSCEKISLKQIIFKEVELTYTLQSHELLVIAKDIAAKLKEIAQELPHAEYKKIILRTIVKAGYESDVTRTDPISSFDLQHIEEIIFEDLAHSGMNIEFADFDWNFVDTIHGEIAEDIFAIASKEIESVINEDQNFITKIAKIRQKIPVLERYSSEELKPLVEKELKRILIGL